MIHRTSTGQGPKLWWSINRGALVSVLIPDLTPVRGTMVRLALQYRAALLQAQLHLQHAQLDMRAHVLARRRRRRRQRRRWWSRAWLSPERRRQFGLYDQLMVELRREDSQSFTNFMRMPPEMFDELLRRIGPRISKQHTFFRAPIEPGMKLAIALRHLAAGLLGSNLHQTNGSSFVLCIFFLGGRFMISLFGLWSRLDWLWTIWPIIIIAADGNRCRWRWSGRWCSSLLLPLPPSFSRCFTFHHDVHSSGSLDGVLPVANPASLYTLHCIRHVTCSHTFAVRCARYTYCTCSVCALHVR